MITKFKSIRKKSKVLNAGHGLMQYYPLLSPCSHSVAQAKERKFTIFTQTIMQLVYCPKFCITIILNISLGTTVIPGRNWKQWFCRVLGATKVDYGLNIKNGEYSTAVHIIQSFSMPNLALLKFHLLVTSVSVSSH